MSFFQALRNFKLHKYPPPPPCKSENVKNNTFLNPYDSQIKMQNCYNVTSQSSSSRSTIEKDEVRKIIGKARLDSQKYGRFTFYLVKWKSKPLSESTWHHPQHLQNAVGRIVPFNINIKGKDLPYFDPKYMLSEPNYQLILNDFVQNFLESKRNRKQSSQSIKAEQQDFEDESKSCKSKNSKNSKTKKITKKTQKNYEKRRDIKITLTQRFKQTTLKQETKQYHNDRNRREEWKNKKYQKNIDNDWNLMNDRKERFYRHKQPNKWNRQERYYKNDKNHRKSSWIQPQDDERPYKHRKEYNNKKYQLQKQKKQKKDELIDAAIRQCFYSKIQKSGSFSNKKTQEKQIQYGEVLDSPQFSKNSDSDQYQVWTIVQQNCKDTMNEKQDGQELIFLSDTYSSEDIQIKAQGKQSSNKNSLQLVEKKSVEEEYCEQNYEPQSGEMTFNQLNCFYSPFFEVEQGELTVDDFMNSVRSLN